ncbi:hypothetical protein [Bacillus dakarensis]|uniref:hypothetical protein n=1 Tax=Robertmurraya dakarensis TaxID=1926278 RepID=UPI0009819694|nr:hypothetical protein [Bacillus dakarensis]
MKTLIDRDKSLEILLERLIMMVGKSNERAEQLHKRILQLEYILLNESPKEPAEKKSFIS